MPVFYFDVAFAGRLFRDEEGQNLFDAAAAETEAIHAAADIAREVLPKRAAEVLEVHLHDERRARLLDVTVAIQVKKAVAEG
jgi:hypothetical protein